MCLWACVCVCVCVLTVQTSWQRVAARWLDVTGVALRLAALLNLIYFMRTGRYTTLAERVAGVEMVCAMHHCPALSSQHFSSCPLSS